MFTFIFYAFFTFTTQADGVHMGKINFPTSGKTAAQPHFEAGVMLLHSFEYEEARNQFKKE